MANQEDVQDIVEAAVNRISSSERLQLLQVQSRIASFYSLKATLGSVPGACVLVSPLYMNRL